MSSHSTSGPVAPNAYRLLYAGFFAILAAGVGFAIRAGLIGSWQKQYGFTSTEIGEKNNIKVSDEEIQRAIVERARQIPGREQEVWDYYRKNPQAVAGIRAPIYEEKVVDFLLELAKVTDKTVTKEELFKEDEDETAKA